MVDHPQTQIELEFGDGTYLFRLGLKQIAELQQKCDAPLGAIFARVIRGRYTKGEMAVGNVDEGAWSIADLTDTIRLGLIGGNLGTVGGVSGPVDPLKARDLVEAYVLGRPLAEAWGIAAAILGALVIGYSPKVEIKPPKKAEATGTTDGSTSPPP